MPLDNAKPPPPEPALAPIRLAYQPPFDWDRLLGYFSARAVEGVEAVVDNSYCRAVAVRDTQGRVHEGWLQAAPVAAGNELELTLSGSLTGVVPECVARVRALFDLDADPQCINQALGDLSADCPGLRIPGAWAGFEMASRAVLGQLISVRAATTLAGRLAALADRPVDSPWPQVRQRYPLADELLALDVEQLGQLGITRRSAAALHEIAAALTDGRLELVRGSDPAKARPILLGIRGVGEWTFSYISMRALGWPDAFLAGDLGIRKALGSIDARAAAQLSERWRPWRSYAVLHLWRRLT